MKRMLYGAQNKKLWWCPGWGSLQLREVMLHNTSVRQAGEWKWWWASGGSSRKIPAGGITQRPWAVEKQQWHAAWSSLPTTMYTDTRFRLLVRRGEREGTRPVGFQEVSPQRLHISNSKFWIVWIHSTQNYTVPGLAIMLYYGFFSCFCLFPQFCFACPTISMPSQMSLANTEAMIYNSEISRLGNMPWGVQKRCGVTVSLQRGWLEPPDPGQVLTPVSLMVMTREISHFWSLWVLWYS